MSNNPDKKTGGWKDKVVLIVEDNELNFKLLEKMLEKTEVKILHAKDGNDAIEICRECRGIDIVLMDIQMPGIDGCEATRIIKNIHPDVPVIAQTAYSLGGEYKRIRESGCDEYLTKPINQKELLDILSDYL